MEAARAHKLLIMVGEEGIEHEARDFEKLSEVIVGEYLTGSDPTSFKTVIIF
jgi:hypothetical protein